MVERLLAATFLVAAAACTSQRARDAAVADSLARDLQLVAAESAAALNDKPNPVAPRPKMVEQPPPTEEEQAAERGARLARGRRIRAFVPETISSSTSKAGEVIHAEIRKNVRNKAGVIVIPKGSTLDITIAQISPAENKSQKDGQILLVPTAVNIRGRSYPIQAEIDSVEHYLKGRGISGGDVLKVGAGTAVGALAGRLIGGNTKGALIGGLVGAAVGTAVAVQTADRDVVVPAGAKVIVTLADPLVVK